MKKIALIVFALFTFSSCIGFHSGNISSGPLISANDEYVDIAIGQSQSYYMFYIGGEYYNSMILAAKKDMYKNRPLKKGEYYANFSCDFLKHIILGVVYTIKVTVSADVLKVSDSPSNQALQTNTDSPKITNLPAAATQTVSAQPLPFKVVKHPNIRNYNPKGNILVNGDSVYYAQDDKNYHLYLVSDLDKQSAILKALSPFTKNVLVPLDKPIFIKNLCPDPWQCGEKVGAEYIDSNNITVYEEGVIAACSNTDVLVLMNSGFHVVPANKLKKKD